MTNVTKSNRFLFTMTGFRELSYRVQTASLGSVNLGSSPFPTSMANLSIPSNKVDFSPLSIRVLLSENLDEWMDAVKWSFDMTHINDSHLDTVSEGTVTILSANNFPIMKVTYHGLSPISISQIDFDITQDETSPTFDLTMMYDSFSITNLITGESIVYSE